MKELLGQVGYDDVSTETEQKMISYVWLILKQVKQKYDMYRSWAQ